jgi:hypothetical protein
MPIRATWRAGALRDKLLTRLLLDNRHEAVGTSARAVR